MGVEENNRVWLIQIRGKKKFSQRELSKASGLSEAMISLIENGKRDPSVRAAKNIAGLLGFDWTLFFQN